MYFFLALLHLINGLTASDGVLQLYYQGEWYGVCQYDYYSAIDYRNGEVVCRELGYDGGIVTSDTRPRVSGEFLWYRPSCTSTEDTLYDCNYYSGFFASSSSCLNSVYVCQSKHNCLI